MDDYLPIKNGMFHSYVMLVYRRLCIILYILHTYRYYRYILYAYINIDKQNKHEYEKSKTYRCESKCKVWIRICPHHPIRTDSMDRRGRIHIQFLTYAHMYANGKRYSGKPIWTFWTSAKCDSHGAVTKAVLTAGATGTWRRGASISGPVVLPFQSRFPGTFGMGMAMRYLRWVEHPLGIWDVRPGFI
jgi:hypothetical protein